MTTIEMLRFREDCISNQAANEIEELREVNAELLAACRAGRAALANVTTRLTLTDPSDLVELGGQGPPWTLWTFAESLEDTIAVLDAAEDKAERTTP